MSTSTTASAPGSRAPAAAKATPRGSSSRATASTSKSARLGELEEKLDAVLCAYVSAYLDLCGPQACAFLGDLVNGYVLLPAPAGEAR